MKTLLLNGISPGYRPDLVVINLGSNDFSTEPHPYKREFVKAYMQIIAQLREHYGNIPILCLYPVAMQLRCSVIMKQ
mgnify:CR=1 FL=1